MSEFEKRFPKIPVDPADVLNTPLEIIKDFDSMIKQVDGLLQNFDQTLTLSTRYLVSTPTAAAKSELPKKGESLDYCVECAIKHSQTAKVLMREAIQRAVASSPSDPGVLEKVRGVVEELVGFEDDTMSAKDERVLALNAAARSLRRMIYASGAEVGRASMDDLKQIKEMIDRLVDITYEFRSSCTTCEVERVCGNNVECLEFLEEAVKKAKTPEDIRRALDEAEKLFKQK
jgi:hypothetical protein